MKLTWLRCTALFVGAVCSVAVWQAVASYIYCGVTKQQDAFAWPYTQWLDMVPYWRNNSLMTLAMVGSALGASVIVGGAINLSWRYLRRPTRSREVKEKPLYGDSRVATETDMTRNQFVLK